jgi:Tfp pilus assembly protein PilF
MPASGQAAAKERERVSDRMPAGDAPTPDAPAEGQTMRARRTERPEMSRIVDLFRDQVGSQISDQDYAAHYDLGMTYMEMDLLSEAIAEFQQALAGADYRQRCLELLATCYSRTGEPEQAAIHWRAAIDESGDAVEQTALRYELACALTEAGKAQEAQQELRVVLNHDPEFLDAQERLAELGG